VTRYGSQAPKGHQLWDREAQADLLHGLDDRDSGALRQQGSALRETSSPLSHCGVVAAVAPDARKVGGPELENNGTSFAKPRLGLRRIGDGD
jgi:hypothetical protein